MYAFFDMHQSLRSDGRVPPGPFPTKFLLTTNCRNTKAIARSASALVGADSVLLPGTPTGEAPALRRAPAAPSQSGLVLEELRRLLRAGILPKQIALIGPASHERGALARVRDVEGVPLITDSADWRRGGGIVVTTARAFKGLEADVVVLYDLGGFSKLFTRSDLYVAWTRARHRLICVCHGLEVRGVIEAALADASPSSSAADAIL